MWLMECAPIDQVPVCGKLVNYYHVVLPESFNGFVEPSRNSMTRYCLNNVSEIRAVARMFHQPIINMAAPLIRNCNVPFSVLLGAIVICIIYNLKRNNIDDIVANSVINTSVNVLMEQVHHNSDMVKMSLACDYLGKVIIAWVSYVSDVELLLRTLLDLRTSDYPLLSTSAAKTLLQTGCAMI